MKNNKIAVLVLGPLDRSPRMLNHAVSFAENMECTVRFIGYMGSCKKPAKVLELDNLSLVYMWTPYDMLKNLPRVFYLFYAVVRIVCQIYQLLIMLYFEDFGTIIVQNPPNIPTFFVLFLLKQFREVSIIVDWHNYGYSIMQSTGSNRYLIAAAKQYELFFGRMIGDVHITVSRAFADDIRK